MKKSVWLTLLLLPFLALAQVKTTQLDRKNIHPSIKYTGKIIEAVSYTDNKGEHIIITTQTGIVGVKSNNLHKEGFRKSDIYAYAYIVKNGEPTLSWQMHDLSGECGFDPKASYIPTTFAVTDLDKNNQAEVWLMYSVACRSDVSPASMKIIMHQGIKKYAVRGESFIKISRQEQYGGKYTMDDAFKTAPLVFRNYVADLWKKNMKETWTD